MEENKENVFKNDFEDSQFLEEEIKTIKEKYKNVYLYHLAFKDDDGLIQRGQVIFRKPTIADVEEYRNDVDRGKLIIASRNLFYKLVVSSNRKEVMDFIGDYVNVYLTFIERIADVLGGDCEGSKKKL